MLKCFSDKDQMESSGQQPKKADQGIKSSKRQNPTNFVSY